MQLVHILDNLDRGGTQTSLRRLVAGLSERGYRQHVICLNEKFNEHVVTAVRQAGASIDIIGRAQLYALIGFWRIVNDLRRRRPDIVLTQLPYGDLIGRTAARIAGVGPVVSRITSRHLEKPRVQLMLDRITARWVDRMAFVAPEIVPFSIAHEGTQPEQVVCIPCGIQADNIDCSEAATHLRRQYGAEEATIIGMVSRLSPTKGHAELLTAFSKISTTHESVQLWLIGDGPERARLITLAQKLGIADQVLFAGDQNNVRDWLTAIDVFVHPTYVEGLSNAVLEAMMAYKPVIATATDGLEGLITSGIHGWLVPPHDPDALADAIDHVIYHPEEAVRIAQAGAERVRTRFSAEREVSAYDDLFKSLIRDSTRSPLRSQRAIEPLEP